MGVAVWDGFGGGPMGVGESGSLSNMYKWGLCCGFPLPFSPHSGTRGHGCGVVRLPGRLSCGARLSTLCGIVSCW